MSAVRLPSGHHGLSRDYVREHQRRRILDAVDAIAARDGYDSCTVAAIIERAGLSRKTFYEHFNDRADAFLAATGSSRQAVVIPTGIPALDEAGYRIVRGPRR